MTFFLMETFWFLLRSLGRPLAVHIKARGVPTYAQYRILALHPRLVLGLATVTQVAQALIHPYPIFFAAMVADCYITIYFLSNQTIQ